MSYTCRISADQKFPAIYHHVSAYARVEPRWGVVIHAGLQLFLHEAPVSFWVVLAKVFQHGPQLVNLLDNISRAAAGRHFQTQRVTVGRNVRLPEK